MAISEILVHFLVPTRKTATKSYYVMFKCRKFSTMCRFRGTVSIRGYNSWKIIESPQNTMRVCVLLFALMYTVFVQTRETTAILYYKSLSCPCNTMTLRIILILLALMNIGYCFFISPFNELLKYWSWKLFFLYNFLP